jgi:hypothetical protein
VHGTRSEACKRSNCRVVEFKYESQILKRATSAERHETELQGSDYRTLRLVDLNSN